jgi:hypothetical protein
MQQFHNPDRIAILEGLAAELGRYWQAATMLNPDGSPADLEGLANSEASQRQLLDILEQLPPWVTQAEAQSKAFARTVKPKPKPAEPTRPPVPPTPIAEGLVREMFNRFFQKPKEEVSWENY